MGVDNPIRLLQTLQDLPESTFDGAFRRTREWEDKYLADAEVVRDDDEAAFSDEEGDEDDGASVGGEEV